METIENTDIYLSLLAGTLLILIMAVTIIIFFTVYRKNLFQKQLQLERNESEHRLQLLKTIIDTTEEERKRIAGDLHDEIGSHLSTVRLTLNNIKSKSEGMQQLLLLADEGKNVIDETIESVRAISHNLLPPGLEKFGLINTLSDLCEKISRYSGLKIEFTASVAIKPASTIELAVYRIFQELLNNTLKHAEASTVDITIVLENMELILDYADDGKGIEIKNKNFKNGLGLKNIEGRITALKGVYTVSTDSYKGFGIEIKIPIDIND